MKNLLFVLLAVCSLSAQSQNPAVALENKPHPLTERYQIMKANAESYQDYKVVKEYILDGVWKITMDSMTKRTQQLAEANAKIKSLEADATHARADLKAKEESMNDIVFASTHINAFGQSFSKGVFLSACAIAAGAFIVVIFLLVAKIKTMQMFVAESKVIVASLTHEFNDYKRNALDKEIKLSRELQTERNKLMELKTRS